MSPAHTARVDLRGADLHGNLRAARFCSDNAGRTKRCRTVTRTELVERAHADLTGAQAPP